jgi:hypothetical protein
MQCECVCMRVQLSNTKGESTHAHGLDPCTLNMYIVAERLSEEQTTADAHSEKGVPTSSPRAQGSDNTCNSRTYCDLQMNKNRSDGVPVVNWYKSAV